MELGGGAIEGGTLQEEILFNTRPELIASLLFTQSFADGESLIIRGSKKYSDYEGYGNSWTCKPIVELDKEMDHVILAVDAKKTFSKEISFELAEVLQQFDKLCSVFKCEHHPNDAIVTGFWGCGSFGGDKDLKAFIQLLAASSVGRKIIFVPFGDEAFKVRLDCFSVWVEKGNFTVKDLLEGHMRLYKSMQEHLKDDHYLNFFIKNYNLSL